MANFYKNMYDFPTWDIKPEKREENKVSYKAIDKITKERAMESLQEEVNRLDKTVMRTIHRKEKPIVPYQTEQDEWQINYDGLADACTEYFELCVIGFNHIDIKKCYTKKKKPTKLLKRLDLDSPIFRSEALGFCDELKTTWYGTDSEVFHLRFVSLVMVNALAYMDDIVESWYEYNPNDLHEWEEKFHLLHQFLIGDLLNFMTNYYTNPKKTNYTDEILTMHQNFAIMGNSKKARKNIDLVVKHSQELLTITHKERFQIRLKASPDIIMDSIVKLALLLTTETTHVWKEKLFKDGCKFRDKCVPDIIMELGKHIRNTKEENIHLLYKIFKQCKPFFFTRFTKLLDNEEFIAGCNAIAYVGFMLDDKTIWKCLGRMLN